VIASARPCRHKKTPPCGGVKRFSASEEPVLLCNEKSALRWILVVPDSWRIHFKTDIAIVVQQVYRLGGKNLEQFFQQGSA
jgi:hypothetical protein